MEEERREIESVVGKAVSKKEVRWCEVIEEEPKPPPRKNKKRRLSKGVGGLGRGMEEGGSKEEDKGIEESLEEEEEETDTEEEIEQDSIPSRLPELLRRDTFCDALDFRVYSLRRLPGRRASSFDDLYWAEEEEEEDLEETFGVVGEEKGRSLEDLRGVGRGGGSIKFQPPPPPPPPPPPSSTPSSMTDSLREFASSLVEILTSSLYLEEKLGGKTLEGNPVWETPPSSSQSPKTDPSSNLEPLPLFENPTLSREDFK